MSYNKAIKPVTVVPSDAQLFMIFAFICAKLLQITQQTARRIGERYASWWTE